MKKLRWQLIIIFLTGLVVGILLLGEQPGNLLPAAPEPARGGIYAEALVGNIQRLNPVLDYYNSVDRDVDRLIYSSLFHFDARGVPQADLVESWGISRDGKIYNFTLRPNIRWHDGEPLTTDDVEFTLGLMRAEGSIWPADLRDFWNKVEFKRLSEDTFQFILPEPFAPFLDYLGFGIVPRHLLGDLSFDQIVDSQFNLQPVGSGPYKFDRLIVENGQIIGVVLSFFEDYYGKKPFLEQIVFRYYPDSAAALQAYREGLVQGISYVSQDVLPAALAEPDLAIYTGRKPELSMILFNLKDPQSTFFQETVVRQALLVGLNRQWMIDQILQGQAILANGPILPGTWAYYDGLKPVQYDPEAAKEMLKEAGYVVPAEGEPIRTKDNLALSFRLIYPNDELHQRLAESIQQDWSLLDINVELEALPYDQLIYERLDGRAYQAALVDLNLSRSPDPDPYPFWDQAQATGGQNYTQWDNRIASEYLEQARITTDMAERERLYRNFQVIFSEELPALPLYYPVYTYAVDRQVQGVQMGPLFDSSDRFATVQNWFLIARIPEVSGSTPTAEQ